MRARGGEKKGWCGDSEGCKGRGSTTVFDIVAVIIAVVTGGNRVHGEGIVLIRVTG